MDFNDIMSTEKQHIEDFLESGLLDRYVISATTDKETEQVEQMIDRYEEVTLAYDNLQEELQLLATMNAVQPPQDLKERVLKASAQTPASTTTTGNNWLSIAAAIVSVIALSGLGYLYVQNTGLKREIVESINDYEQLEKDYELNDAQKRILEERLIFIEAADTEKYLMRGYIKEEPLRVIAYYNQPAGKAQIEIASLPMLDDAYDYQLWADVDGEMVSLAVLNDMKPKIISADILKNASDLNITIEKTGGSKHASVENLVSSIPLDVRP